MNILAVLALAWALNVYQAEVVSVTDGDTVRVVVAVWVDQEVRTAIRVRGLDTPELRGKCASEIALAKKAQERARQLMPVGSRVTLTQVDSDKFGGRYNADIYLRDGKSFAKILISEGLARPYDGGKRQGWCSA